MPLVCSQVVLANSIGIQSSTALPTVRELSRVQSHTQRSPFKALQLVTEYRHTLMASQMYFRLLAPSRTFTRSLKRLLLTWPFYPILITPSEHSPLSQCLPLTTQEKGERASMATVGKYKGSLTSTRGGQREDDLKRIVSSYEAKLAQARGEISGLKAALQSLQEEYRALINQQVHNFTLSSLEIVCKMCGHVCVLTGWLGKKWTHKELSGWMRMRLVNCGGSSLLHLHILSKASWRRCLDPQMHPQKFPCWWNKCLISLLHGSQWCPSRCAEA